MREHGVFGGSGFACLRRGVRRGCGGPGSRAPGQSRRAGEGRGAIETDVFQRRFRRWEFGDSEKCLTSRIVECHTWDPAQDNRYFHDTATQAHDVVRRVIEGLPPRTTARDALQTMRVVEAAEHSAQLRRPVRIEELATLGDYLPPP